MKFRQIITAATIALLPFAASAATLIIPAAGSGFGVNDSRWQSELTFHNLSSSSVTVGMTFHDGKGAEKSDSVSLNPRSTLSIGDIVNTRFGVEAGTGAIELRVPDEMASRLAVNSRTFNSSANGQFGQDVPAVNANDAAMAGDTVVLQGPSNATENRYNFGIYALTAATVRWDLIRADGTRAASVEQTYSAGTQFQYNNGVVTLLGGTAADDDTIQALVVSGSVIAYGSAINNASGDPTFVPGIRGRADVLVKFIGVDIAGDGTIDVTDANHDGILDQPIDLYMTAYPTYFRVVATGPNDEPLTLSFINPPDDAHFVDTKGDVQWYPSPSEGPMTTLKVLATWSGGSEVLTIPVHLH